MILTGSEIIRRVHLGHITIDPFDERQVNPNSYNYRLGKRVKCAPRETIDPRHRPQWADKEIPPTGMLLEPGRLYLGHTLESIGSRMFVTSLIGRSSVGRLGLFLQLSADLGQLGAIHCWTLEMNVVQPLRLYPGMIIGQVSFWVPDGQSRPYRGVYADTSLPLESRADMRDEERV